METADTKKSRLMDTSRLEIFSDGVMAVIITIAVLEFKTPIGNDFHALIPLLPLFFTYIVSFQTIGTYWNNHHHLLKVTKEVSPLIMWANLHLLFWLSLIPFSAGWLGANHNQPFPTLVYSIVLLMCAIAYQLLQRSIQNNEGKRSFISRAIGDDLKGKLSFTFYILAVASAYYIPWLADIFIVAVAIMWFFPDRRFERAK